MGRFVARRLLQTLLLAFLVTFSVLVLLHSSGDPAAFLVPLDASQETIRAVRHDLGLDRPLPVQYMRFLGFAFSGQLQSYRFHRSAFPMALEYFSRSTELVLLGTLIAGLCALPLGVSAASYRGSVVDVTVLSLALVGQAMPLFWLAMLLIQLLALKLRLL